MSPVARRAMAAAALTAWSALALPATSAAGDPRAAPGIDLHAFWDDRCQSCHGHAGDFARSSLTVRDGRLVGRHHDRDLPDFLRHHGVAADLVEPVTAMLAAQAASAPRYASACRDCHGPAADFARQALHFDAGILRARASGRPVAEVLPSHGGLAPDEQAAMLQTLMRVRREVGG